MDHATGTIFQHNMGALCTIKIALCYIRTVLCEMRTALCHMRTTLCNMGALCDMGVRYVIWVRAM